MIFKKLSKTTIICLSVLLVLILFSIISFAVDSNRVDNGKKPILCIMKFGLNDGGTTVYYGLGYQIINWKRFSPDNPDKMLVGIEKHYMVGMVDPSYKPKIELMEIDDYSEGNGFSIPLI